mmetsp:Transcript_27786/g.50750  ORF Transcript_27786/g.50750 Transcript_27786/m.50750 type:complete len:180 (-) Transcript_27786:32-571(-)
MGQVPANGFAAQWAAPWREPTSKASLTEQNVAAASNAHLQQPRASPSLTARSADYSDSESGLSDWQFQPTVRYPPSRSTTPTPSGSEEATKCATYAVPFNDVVQDPLGLQGDHVRFARPDVPRLNLGRSSGGSEVVCRLTTADVGGRHGHKDNHRGCDLGPVSEMCPLESDMTCIARKA